MSTKKKQTDYLTPIKANLHKIELNKPYMFTKLCRTLELEVPKASKSKIALLKALDSLVVRVEEGKKHIITELRAEQVEIIDNRGKSEGSRGNYEGIFKDNLTNSLLYFCLDTANKRGAFKNGEDDFVLTTSKHNIMCEMGMRNRHNTYVATHQPINFCNQLSLERVVLDFTMHKLKNNTAKAFDRILDSIVKTGLAIQEQSMGVVRYKATKEVNGVATEWDTRVEIKSFATKKERIDIELTKTKIANDMKFKTVGALYSTNNGKVINDFHEKIDGYTVEKYGILESYPLIELHMRKSVIDNYLQKFEGITLEELVELGNEKFLNQQKSSFKRSHTNYMNGKTSKDTKAFVQGLDNYLEQNQKILKYLIDVYAKKLTLLEGGDLKQDMLTGEIEERINYIDLFDISNRSRNKCIIN